MQLNHIHLKVSNIEKAKDFYKKILGFKVRESLGPFIFLHLGEEHHSLALQEKENTQQNKEDSLGLYHFSLEVNNEKEFKEIIKKLKENKIEYSPVDHIISKVIYFEDPDKNGIEIMLDTRSSKGQEWKGKNLPFYI